MQGTKDGRCAKRLPTPGGVWVRLLSTDKCSAVTQGYASHEPPLGRGTAPEMQGRR